MSIFGVSFRKVEQLKMIKILAVIALATVIAVILGNFQLVAKPVLLGGLGGVIGAAVSHALEPERQEHEFVVKVLTFTAGLVVTVLLTKMFLGSVYG